MRGGGYYNVIIIIDASLAQGEDLKCLNFFNFILQRFSVAEERRISQEIELQSYLNGLIIDEKKR